MIDIKTEVETNFVSREMCKKAIQEWSIVKEDYDLIKKIIIPNGIFSFSSADCNWLKEKNKYEYFHIYIGIYNKKLISIIVPLDENGKEIELDLYLTSELTTLKNELNLIEEKVVKTIKTTILSEDLKVKDYREEIQLPYSNTPSLSENKSLEEIRLWRNECLDWFYHESKMYDGKRIFKTFTVPRADLVRNSSNVSEVVCLFGFRKSTILDRHVPSLIFVSVDEDKSFANILKSGDEEIVDDTKDFASPCPPFCKDDGNFIIFN